MAELSFKSKYDCKVPALCHMTHFIAFVHHALTYVEKDFKMLKQMYYLE